MIPVESEVYKALEKVAKTAQCVAFSGLPGVGKSLYVNEFYAIVKKLGRKIIVIQWDIARKAFETPEILERYPMSGGTIHNGVKLAVGAWLVKEITYWLQNNPGSKPLLLIEAPLVGHRFLELVKEQRNPELESFLKSKDFRIIMPIPSKEVRAIIEDERRAQVSEDAKQWKGAKPSVMLMLWKMICGIANEFGKDIPMDGQPPYDPKIYEYVFSEILKHRHFIPLHVNEVFQMKISDEDELHNLNSLVPSSEEAHTYTELIDMLYADQEEIDMIVNSWYFT